MYEKNLKISYLLDFYGDVLTEKQRDVMDLYYNQDLSLAEIAEHIGITRQGVRDAIKRGGNVILSLEDKLGFAHKSDEYKKAFEVINECIRVIESSDENENYCEIVDTNAKKIVKVIKGVL